MMKSSVVAFFTTVLAIVVNVENADASKFCFGVGTSKGSQFELSVSLERAELSNVRGDISDIENDVYKRISPHDNQQGKFGTNYLVFHSLKTSSLDSLLVDESLLRNDSTGIVKLVGSVNDSYFCHEMP